MRRIEIHWVDPMPGAESIIGEVRVIEGDKATNMHVFSSFMIEKTANSLRRYRIGKDQHLARLPKDLNLLIGAMSDTYLRGLQAKSVIYTWGEV